MICTFKTLCFSGHRRLPKDETLTQLKQNLYFQTLNAIHSGYHTFLFGGAIGFDILAAQTVQQIRSNPLMDLPPIKLIAILPFAQQAETWHANAQKEHDAILSHCDQIILLSQAYHPHCYAKRNQYMIDTSQALLCYWNHNTHSGTGQTVNMARRKQLPITNLYQGEDHLH